MTTQRAHQIILLSGLATLTFGFLNSFRPSEQARYGQFPSIEHVRLFVGAGIVFIGLSAVAEFAPGIAAPFAVAIGTTAVVVQGAPVLNELLTLTGYQTPKGKP